MTFELAVAAILSLLFVGAGLLKLWRPLSFQQGLAKTFQVGTREAKRAAIAVAIAELAIAGSLVIAPTRLAAAAAAFVWCIVALAYQIHTIRSSGSCGCLGGSDPLRTLGPLRWFLYLIPYAIISAVLLALQLPNEAPSSSLPWSAVIALGLLSWIGLMWRRGVPADAPEPAKPAMDGWSRRSFLRRAAATVAALVLLPTFNRLRVLADTCGAWSCVRYEVVCLCCGCRSNGTSCDACYQRRRRTCYGSYGSYVQEQLVTGVCYANICSPCGRSYVSSCGRCCPCPA